MKDLLSNPGFIALMGTLFGGVGLKIIEHWLNKSKERSAEQAAVRNEYREEIEDLKAEIVRLNAAIDEWKNKYYTVREEKNRVDLDLKLTLERLETLRVRLDAMDKRRSN